MNGSVETDYETAHPSVKGVRMMMKNRLKCVIAGAAVLVGTVLGVQPAHAIIVIDDFQDTNTLEDGAGNSVTPTPVAFLGSGATGVNQPGSPLGIDYELNDREVDSTPVVLVDKDNPNSLAPNANRLDGIAGGSRQITLDNQGGVGSDMNVFVSTRFDAQDQFPDAFQTDTLRQFNFGAASFSSPATSIPFWRLVYDADGAGFNNGAGFDITENGGNTTFEIHFDFVDPGAVAGNNTIVIDLFDAVGGSGDISRDISEADFDTPPNAGAILRFHINDLLFDKGEDGGLATNPLDNVDLTQTIGIAITFNDDGGSAPDFVIERIIFTVPEPATLSLLGLAGLGLLSRRRRSA